MDIWEGEAVRVWSHFEGANRDAKIPSAKQKSLSVFIHHSATSVILIQLRLVLLLQSAHDLARKGTSIGKPAIRLIVMTVEALPQTSKQTHRILKAWSFVGGSPPMNSRIVASFGRASTGGGPGPVEVHSNYFKTSGMGFG